VLHEGLVEVGHDHGRSVVEAVQDTHHAVLTCSSADPHGSGVAREAEHVVALVKVEPWGSGDRDAARPRALRLPVAAPRADAAGSRRARVDPLRAFPALLLGTVRLSHALAVRG
jgi:hypothetical protein